MTLLLRTTDHTYKVVPVTLMFNWSYIENIVEECQCGDDVVPIPLTDAQYDVWLDLCIQMDSRHIENREVQPEDPQVYVRGNLGEWFVVDCTVPLPPRSLVLPIIRLMDPEDLDWVLYCTTDTFLTLDESREDKRHWYKLIGQSIREVGLLDHPLGSCFILQQDCQLCVQECMSTISGYDVWTHRSMEDANVVAGIVYTDWVNLGMPGDLQWDQVSWAEVIRMGVGEMAHTMLNPRQTTPLASLMRQSQGVRTTPLLISVLACDFTLPPPTQWYESYYSSYVMGTKEYQRRLGLWLEYMLPQSREGHLTISEQQLINLSNVHCVAVGDNRAKGGVLALSSHVHTPSTKRLLQYFVDYLVRTMDSLPKVE